MKPEIKFDVRDITGSVRVNVRAWIADTKNGLEMLVDKSQVKRAKKLLERQLIAEHNRVQAKIAIMKHNAPDQS